MPIRTAADIHRIHLNSALPALITTVGQYR